MKKGRLSQSEKDQALAKGGDLAALKRLAKKLDRSVETLQKFVESQAKTVMEPEQIVAPETVPNNNVVLTDMYGNPKAPRPEQGVMVATERSSSKVDSINKKMNRNTVEEILRTKPDSTARIR